MILRDRDITNGWAGAGDGVLEERAYLLQNWRADVIAIIGPNGGPQMYYRYDAYGVPTAIHPCDINADGVVDLTDFELVLDMQPNFDQRGDFADDFGLSGPNGVVDFSDIAYMLGAIGPAGRGFVADADAEYGGLRKLYAGYEYDPSLAGIKYHVRNRVYDAEQGRWNRRDPLGYVDGMSLYQYARSMPVQGVDPMGLGTIPACPAVKPDPGTLGDGWVPDLGTEHCGLDCIRSVTSVWKTRGGQQCCYGKSKGDPGREDDELNQDPDCMGTIDLWGMCKGEDENGECIVDLRRTVRHLIDDWRPYHNNPSTYREAHCCLRNCGVPSGTSEPGGGIKDDDGWRDTWKKCLKLAQEGRIYCGTSSCGDEAPKPPQKPLRAVPQSPGYIPVLPRHGIGSGVYANH